MTRTLREPQTMPVGFTTDGVAKRPSSVFAAQMRIQRERKGWTQQQLAARLAMLGFVVHQTTIGKWEAGERRISLDEALAIAAALDVSPVHMLSGSYLTGRANRPGIALSDRTPAATAREVRLWIRGRLPLWGQDPKRYHTEISPDEWQAMRRSGAADLLKGVDELVEAWADDDLPSALDCIEWLEDELSRQRRALQREAGRSHDPADDAA